MVSPGDAHCAARSVVTSTSAGSLAKFSDAASASVRLLALVLWFGDVKYVVGYHSACKQLGPFDVPLAISYGHSGCSSMAAMR